MSLGWRTLGKPQQRYSFEADQPSGVGLDVRAIESDMPGHCVAIHRKKVVCLKKRHGRRWKGAAAIIIGIAELYCADEIPAGPQTKSFRLELNVFDPN